MAIVQPGGSQGTGSSLPIGAPMDWYGTYASIPANFLPADGAAVSRTTYAALFAILGEGWGPGDGSTTFNLPDLRNIMYAGADSDDGCRPTTNINAACGPANEDCGGSYCHTHDISNLNGASQYFDTPGGTDTFAFDCNAAPPFGATDDQYILPVPYVAIIKLIKVL